MDLFDITLSAGIESQTSVAGRYFRILSGEGRLRIKASNGADSSIITGIGVDLGPFDWFRLTSSTDQTITVLVSDLPTTDSRLTGDVDINGLLSVVNAGGSSFSQSAITLSGSAAVEVFAEDSARLVGTFQADVDVWIGPTSGVDDSTGIKIAKGATVNIENSGKLFGYSTAAGSVRTLESKV
jgi:hypothetical protein